MFHQKFKEHLNKRLATIIVAALPLAGLSANSALAMDKTDTISAQREKGVDAIRAFYAGDVETMDGLIANIYIQHNFTAKDGKADLRAVLAKGKKEGWLNPSLAAQFEPLRVVSEGDLMAMHYRGRSENKVWVDIFRFDEDGKITEHWDVWQVQGPLNKSNRSLTDGAGDPLAKVSQEQLDAHKAVVRRIMDEYFDRGDASILLDLIDPRYFQHNPHGADGLKMFSGLVERFGGRIENTVHRLIAQGDLVYAQMHYPQLNAAAVDIFRFENGKVVEHWDVLTEIPDSMPHDNGAF